MLAIHNTSEKSYKVSFYLTSDTNFLLTNLAAGKTLSSWEWTEYDSP